MKNMRLLLRFLTVGGLVLLLLIPLTMIRGSIQERQMYRNQAVAQVEQSVAGAQAIAGPLRVVPWTETREVDTIDARNFPQKKVETIAGYELQTPRSLRMEGRLVPDTRKLGLHEVRIYTWRGSLNATFDQPLPKDQGVRRYGQPYLILGVQDVRGFVGTPRLTVDGRALRFAPGTREAGKQLGGVHALLPVAAESAPPGRDVKIEFALAGTESLAAVPVGDSNNIQLHSAWPHPQFGGRFLPQTRKIGDAGFDAGWDISSLATDAQSQLAAGAGLVGEKTLDSLQVSLVDPVNIYSQADRASKYGILFIVLTFVGFAMFELIKRLPIHPLQYLLVGLALAIFFLLLLSLSEHIPFWQAYLAAAAACIGLLGFYLSHVLRSRMRALGFATMLTLLYGVLYGLLVSEDNALLMGSLLLFGILAGIMWVTRKVDWYELGSSLR
ncbi:cell envelope integrity protein CreD [Luteimonas gilva]|uniref:Cell envelope integrity protein CreD n=1 Tax=Luteimonas gilva TaxID=2572684 RepID=A0A4U5JTQ4_9GAMM|nr:cell envelope integrity protein CreD [Luteimonas gilva]TKR32875.1 cell envelope integrity protein CreD [Luteimonas gilva]